MERIIKFIFDSIYIIIMTLAVYGFRHLVWGEKDIPPLVVKLRYPIAFLLSLSVLIFDVAVQSVVGWEPGTDHMTKVPYYGVAIFIIAGILKD
tara:strand:+ start:131 stop:409 length:279 start_codon:yes stop_codon:yes gene_type:complete